MLRGDNGDKFLEELDVELDRKEDDVLMTLAELLIAISGVSFGLYGMNADDFCGEEFLKDEVFFVGLKDEE